ncbi:MAG TPA: uroporphyrinogen decarboxylase family protein [Dehalococcoidia bacterium]
MTTWERVQAALHGEPVDRVPLSCWGHDYLREWTAEGLAEATLEFQRRYGWDFIKVNPRATYYAEAWGARFRPSGDPLRGPLLVEAPLRTAADLRRIQPVDPSAGPFAEQLTALRLMARELRGEVPLLQTVFNPLSVIGRLTAGESREERAALVRGFMREAPEALHAALAAVAATLAGYAARCLEAGAAGVFFATVDWGTRDVATDGEYLTFARPYDLTVLTAVREAPFNVLHVCGARNMLDLLADYPVHAFNWAADLPGNPGLREARERYGRAVMGGLDERRTLPEGSPEEVAEQVRRAIRETGGRGVLVAPGCSIPPQTPEANLRAAVQAARTL